MTFRCTLLAGCLSLLVACGGGSDSSSDSDAVTDTSPPVETPPPSEAVDPPANTDAEVLRASLTGAGGAFGPGGAFESALSPDAENPSIVALITDQGTVGQGRIIDPTIQFAGHASQGYVVQLYLNGQLAGSSLARSDGLWILDYSVVALDPGAYSVTLIGVDTAGGSHESLSPFAFLYDPSAPPAPVVAGVSDDTAIPGDGYTSDNSLFVHGTAEPFSSVEVFFNGTLLTTATANNAGEWSVDHTATMLADGTYLITAESVYLGLRSATSTPFALVVDTQAPLAPAVTAITPDTGADTSDGVTNSPNLAFSGTAEAFATVQVQLDNNLIGTTTASAAGVWNLDYSAISLAEGSYQLDALQIDRAGNASPLSAPSTLVVDLTAPAVPSVDGFTADTGVTGDQITADNTLLFNGSADPDVTVTLLIDDVAVGTVFANGAGAWSFDYTDIALANGIHTVTVLAADLAGNLSAASAPFTVTVDTLAPAAPVITDISEDTGVAGDSITSDTTLIFSGTAEANTTVDVMLNAVSIGTTAANGAGVWNFDYTGTVLAQGNYSVTATATNIAGSTSATSAAFNISINTDVPAAPSVTAITTDTGTAGDGITSDNTLIINGTAEANVSINVLIDAVSIGIATANGAGTWSFDHTGTTLADNSYAITATATDGAGNTSAASATFNITVDTGVPAAPAVTAITNDTGTAGDGITSDNTLVISGTAEANASINVFIDAVSIGTATANGAGEWSFDHTGTTLADATYTITATANDSAGNASVTSAAFNIIVDAGVPTAPAVTAITTDTGTAGDGITSDNTLVISGTAEANASINVFIDAVSIGTATTNGAGVWSYDHTGTMLADDTYAITATTTDGAGNTSAASVALNITVDTGTPSAPVVTAISTDTGTAGDGVTSDNTLIISGTSEANASINVLIDAVSIGTATANGAGVWSYDYTGTTLADNSYAITATATDGAGNTSATSTALNITVDTGTPAVPAVATITTDSGTAGDGITNDNTLVISGTAEANATISVLIDAVSIGTATANGAGNWSFDHTGTTLADNSYAITATATDSAANTSATSAAFNIIVDTGTPAAPAVTSITTDTGTAGDGITSDNTLIISGTAEANASVNVLIDAVSIGAATANGAGNWSFDHTGTTLADNSYAITATAADGAGNTSTASAAFNITVDSGTPAAPTVTAITTDTGTASDGITNDNTLVISGTAEANASINVFIDAVSIGAVTTNGSGVWSFDYTGTTLADNTYAITATSTDNAGNTSAASAAFNVTIDTGTPAAPAATAITTDTGTAADGITSDNTLIISGTAEANATINVFIDAVSIGTATANGAGVWSFDHTDTTLADDTYAITATAIDSAANTSAVSAALNITVDTGTPAAPAVTAITTDTGTAGDGITSDNTLIISGTAEANASINVLIDAVSIGTATANGAGNWSFDHTGTTLADNSYAITATATDSAANTSATSAAFNITVDTGTPAAPAVTAITTDTGTAGDGITSDNTLVISGTAEANASINVFIDASSIGTTTANGAGVWSYDYTGTTLADNSYSITATATDGASNTSAASTALNITVDTGTPAVPAVATITTDSGTAGDGITSDNTLIISGTSEANASINVLIDAVSIGTATANGAGVWNFDHTSTTLADDTYIITATATDSAGNTSAASAGFNIIIDTGTPAAPAVTSITTDTGTASDGITSDNTLIISGTSEANAIINVLIDAVSIGTATANGAGVWSFDHTGTTLADDNYAITATATDNAGSTSAVSAVFNITVDTGTPAAPVVTAITNDTGTASDGITSDNTLIISGTSEANTTINVLIDAVSIGTATANGAGTWSFDHTGTTLADNTYVITATASDAAANTSATSTDFSITIDTGVPSAPSVTTITDDTGVAADEITYDTTLIFSGTGEANANVEVFIDGGSIGITTTNGAGNWTFDHTATTLGSATYAVTATMIDDAGNVSPASSALNVTVDATAPGIDTLTPIDGAVSINFTQNLSIQFDETVYAASGNIVIREYIDDSVFESIPITDGRVTGDGTNTLTVNPSAAFVGGTQYYVEIDSGAVTDLAGNGFAGYSGNGNWAFTTVSTGIAATTPADEAANVVLDTSLTFTFNEAVTANIGNVLIRKISDDTIVDTLDLSTVPVGGDGSNTIVLAQTGVLDPATAYYVEIEPGAFINANNVAFAGISGNSTLNFSTENASLPAVTNVTSSVPDATYQGNDLIPLQVTFDESVNVTGSPQLHINLDGSDKFINYSSGSGSTTLVFNYTVATGDATSDLEYVSANSLVLNGGTIRSSTSSANATLTLPAPGAAGSLGANKNIVITAAEMDMSSFTSADGFYINGYEVADYIGTSVGSGGDVNGDGFEDIVIGVSLSDIDAGDAGAAYVIFGQSGATRSDIAVSSLATADGFLIHGATAADYLGMSVQLAGDLNGDGYDEVIVIASHDDTGASDAGTLYVIWGQAGATHSNIDLSTMTAADGFRILGYEAGDHLGYTNFIDPRNAQFLDSKGDFNGDGIHDLLIGHHTSDVGGANRGVVYVIFGATGATRADIDLSSLGSDGFQIVRGTSTEELLGQSVQYIKDFNGDGYNDVLVGAGFSDEVAGDAGQAFVVFGHGGPTFNDIDVSTLNGSDGFKISTSEAASWFGASVGATDINGDGLTDLLIGNVASNTNGQGDSGSILVLYGKVSGSYADVNFGSVAMADGFTIHGEDVSDFVAHAVEGAGDVNGDGIGDLLVSTWVDDEGGGDAGAAWVIYGEAGVTRPDIDLKTLTSSDGFKIIGDAGADYFGRANAVGDVNGDGYQDLIISSPLGNNAAVDAGEVNVIWGKDFTSLVFAGLIGNSSANDIVGTSGDDTIVGGGGADAVSAGSGDDIIQVSDLTFRRIDGGRGSDTLELTGSALSLDLRTLNYERIQGIELINLGDNGNGLLLDKLSLLALSDEVRTLYVQGGSSDWVVTDAVETWVPNGTTVVNTITYNRYDLDAVSLYVQDTLSQPVTPAAPVITSFSNDTGTPGDDITSDTGLIFSGTTGAYFDIEIFVDASTVGTTTANSAGAWTFDYSGTSLSSGTYSITAVATNLGGYSSSASSTLSVTVDASAPPAPAITTITTDSGLADGVTNDNTLVISGTAEANSTVTVLLDGGSIGTTSANGAGTWSFDYTGTSISDGSYVLTATASDTAGNTSVASGNFNITIDTAAPAAPSVTAITTDSGSADGVTNDSTLIISGTAEANSTVTVFLDGGSIGTTTANGTGVWSFDYTGTILGDGSYVLTATASDSAANTSAVSTDFNITIDTSTPAAPTVTAITTDSGAANGITNDNTLVISGTAEANALVTVLLDGGSIGTTTANGAGVWSFDYTGTVLGDGGYVLTATATDAAANTSPVSADFNITIDTGAPAAPAVTAITTDSGATDGVTSDNTLIISGTAEANALITLLLDSGSIGTTTANGAGVWSFDYTGTILSDGNYVVTATATDSAANTSAVSADFTITIDTSTPAAPAVTTITVDSGNADGVTNDNTLIISGTAEANSTVTVLLDGGSIGTTSANGAGAWSFDYTGTSLSDGSYVLTATVTDGSGNTSVASGNFNITIDTGTPAAPAVTAITTDTGTAGDGITSDNTLVISGTAEANSTVTVLLDGGSIGTTSTNGAGAWSFDYTGTSISDGSYVLTATASDTAGNTSAAASNFNITIDTGTPAAPSVTAITNDTATGGDGITSDNTLVISGTSEANATVDVLLDGGSIGTTTANGAGAWSYDHTGTSISDGSFAITATATDNVGNTSTVSSAFNITIDTSAPVINTLSPTDGSTTVAFNASLVIVFNETVTAQSGDIVIYNGGGSTFETIPVGDARVTGSGTNTITINPNGTFAGGSNYYVQIAAGAFADGLSNTFAGISDNTTWNFTTAPTSLSSTTPADGATDQELDVGLTLVFNEAVTVNSGDIRIRKLSDNTTVDTIDVVSGQITGSGTTTISVAQTSYLDPVTNYYVEIDAGAFRNANSVAYVGISDNTTWNFTTKFVTTPTVTNVTSSVANGTYRGGDKIPIQITFSEAVNVLTSGGKPRLLLSLNAGNIYVPYTSGSGTTTLTFNYTVALGDTTADLAYVSATALELNGGVIRSVDYANADLTLPSPGASGSLNNNKNIALSGATKLDVTALRAADGFFITGAEASTVYFGHSVSSGGDFNGDGFEDLAIGVPDSNISNTSGGYAYLVYGKAGATRAGIAMSSLSSSDGFHVSGAATGDNAGSVVDISGDLNGDGYDDMIVLASKADDGATTGGNIYVIWGNSAPTGIDLASDFSNRTSGFTNTKGFVITSYESSDEIGSYDGLVDPNNAQYIDASGDFNGDGINDLLIGHEQGDDFDTNSGYVYVIFGQAGATRANFRLDAYATHGFRMYSAESTAHLGRAQFLGDYNGDGYSDILIGAPGIGSDDGEAYVVFGSPGSSFSDIDVATLNGTNGFAISTVNANAWLGGSLGAADVNGDGLSDLIVGVPQADYASRSENGAAMVVYGTSNTPHNDLTLESLPASRGYIIYGENTGDIASFTAHGIKDMNGDGVDDVMLSSGEDDNAGTNAGAAWVVFGKTGTSRGNIDLNGISASDGFQISGDAGDDRFGQSATSGDLNGDGFQDIMVSSVAGDNAGSFAGEVNVIWGKDFWGEVDISGSGTGADENLLGTDGDDTIISNGGQDAVAAGSGNDIIEISDTGFFNIDGGRGNDTLKLTTPLNALDLTAYGEEIITDIEIIDLSDNGNNLTVSEITVLGLSRETGILYVKGGSSDAVIPTGSDTWSSTGSANVDGVDYNIYQDGGAYLYIQNTIDATAIP